MTAGDQVVDRPLAGSEKREVVLTVNDRDYRIRVQPRMLLVDAIRDQVGLTGTHIGCDSTSCGACTVLLDGRAVKSCTMFGVQAEGSSIRTVEWLSQQCPAGELHPLQRAFEEKFAYQCGYCTPGMLMSALALYEASHAPSKDEIRVALVGNLCRCTGYEPVVEAIGAAIARLEGDAR
ncbi:MAG: (2Fe-2S)-binding protein [Sciscionella sp.]